MPFELHIDAERLKDIQAELGATGKQAQRALKRAQRYAARWTGTRIVRYLSAETGIQQKVLRRRKGKARGNAAGVWIGLNPVGLGRLKPRATAQGVVAARRQYSGAFIRGRAGGPVVFKRRGRKRLPVDALNVGIHDEGIAAVKSLRTDGEEAFLREFTRLLRVELEHGR